MKSGLIIAATVIFSIVAVSIASNIPWSNSRRPQRPPVVSPVIARTFPGQQEVATSQPIVVPSLPPESLFSNTPLTLGWQTPTGVNHAYDMMFSKYLPGLLRDMKPPVDLNEKYHEPSSFLPKSILGFKPWFRAGDSLTYDIPGTYMRTGDIYFMALGATRPINGKLAVGVDAYVVADSPANASEMPGSSNGPNSGGSPIHVGTYDLATFGTGPSLTYSQKIFIKDVDFRLQFFHEFNGDGTSGDGVFLSAGFDF